VKIKSPRRLIISVMAVVVVLAAIGAFVWPGFFDTTDSGSTSAASPATVREQDETDRDEAWAQEERTFDQVIREDAAFYNCPVNEQIKQYERPSVNQLVPCGTDIVEINYTGSASEDVPQVKWLAGDGNDNVVTTKYHEYDPYRLETQPSWTLDWTAGEGSTFLQLYVRLFCPNEGFCWRPVSLSAASSSTGEFSYPLMGDVAGVGLVFTDGTSGTMVPHHWWVFDNRWVR
jgi:hypothetical protein